MPSIILYTLTTILLISCGAEIPEMMDEEEVNGGSGVEVIEVNVSGAQDRYTFSVKLQSPDTGCEQYADWWEVISEDGELIHRRNLGHSHVNEQPFSRSGSPVEISASQTVIVRGHMNNLGYGTKVMKGNVTDGFIATDLAADFAEELETTAPLPPDCAF